MGSSSPFLPVFQSQGLTPDPLRCRWCCTGRGRRPRAHPGLMGRIPGLLEVRSSRSPMLSWRISAPSGSSARKRELGQSPMGVWMWRGEQIKAAEMSPSVLGVPGALCPILPEKPQGIRQQGGKNSSPPGNKGLGGDGSGFHHSQGSSDACRKRSPSYGSIIPNCAPRSGQVGSSNPHRAPKPQPFRWVWFGFFFNFSSYFCVGIARPPWPPCYKPCDGFFTHGEL